MSRIEGLADLRPGDIMFGPIGGAVGLGVGLGQLALGEAFRVGRLSIRHVGIVVEAGRAEPVRVTYVHGPARAETLAPASGPRLVQAMPGGAEEIELTEATHWTDRHAYVRLPEDWPGQAGDAAAIARLMVREGVAYSFASYAALALWRWGVKTPRLEKWIGRRRRGAIRLERWSNGPNHPSPGQGRGGCLPVEAICSVLVDQAWSLAGKRVVDGTKPQIVTPGMLAGQLWRQPGVVWAGPGLL
jgi:hypothetical protein